MNVLLLYASHFGQTRKIAMKIAERLRELGARVETYNADVAHPPSPGIYDAVVLGSRVERGVHAMAIREYIDKYRSTLQRMPTAFFSVSMAAASPGATFDPDGYMTSMFDKLAWKPTRAAAFAGGLPSRHYNWFLRFIMKQISTSAGHTTDTSRDHEFTNWNAVREFADDIAALAPLRDVARVL